MTVFCGPSLSYVTGNWDRSEKSAKMTYTEPRDQRAGDINSLRRRVGPPESFAGNAWRDKKRSEKLYPAEGALGVEGGGQKVRKKMVIKSPDGCSNTYTG